MNKNTLTSGICAWIPERVSNRHLLACYELLGKAGKPFRFRSESSVQKNTEAFARHRSSVQKNGGYVEDQAAYGDMIYGASTLRQAGCGVLAVYNALYTLGETGSLSLPELIHEFESEGMVLSGRLGTSPLAIRRFLNRNGRKTAMVTDPTCFDSFAEKYISLILTVYNNRTDLRDGLHIICISADRSGFTAHNTGCSKSPSAAYPSVTALIRSLNGGNAEGICLIGIEAERDIS